MTHQLTPAQRVIVALDVNDPVKALVLVEKLAPLGVTFKLGLEFINALIFNLLCRDIVRFAENLWACIKLFHYRAQFFWDIKLKDIPHTVEGASRVIACMGVKMFNLHIDGGTKMMKAAVAGAVAEGGTRPLVIGVTALTSLGDGDYDEMGLLPCEVGEEGMEWLRDHVVSLARLGQVAGLDGVVASVHEATAIREACGPNYLIITPGIRWSATADDQVRVGTPYEAIRNGSDLLVIGRNITGQEDPVAAAQFAIAEIKRALADQAKVAEY